MICLNGYYTDHILGYRWYWSCWQTNVIITNSFDVNSFSNMTINSSGDTLVISFATWSSWCNRFALLAFLTLKIPSVEACTKLLSHKQRMLLIRWNPNSCQINVSTKCSICRIEISFKKVLLELLDFYENLGSN